MIKFIVCFFTVILWACAPSKHTPVAINPEAPIESPRKKKKYLPVCITYENPQPQDSIKKILEGYFLFKLIKLISIDEAKNLQEVEVKRVYNAVLLRGASDPNEILKETERMQKKVVNRISISISHPKKIKWLTYSLPLNISRRDIHEPHEITAKEMEGLSMEEILQNLAAKIFLSGELREE